MPSCEAKCKTNLICAVNETGSKGSKVLLAIQCNAKKPIFYPTVLGSNPNIDASVLLSVIVLGNKTIGRKVAIVGAHIDRFKLVTNSQLQSASSSVKKNQAGCQVFDSLAHSLMDPLRSLRVLTSSHLTNSTLQLCFAMEPKRFRGSVQMSSHVTKTSNGLSEEGS